jgi:hypothetical protein
MSSEVWLSPLEIHKLRLMCANPFLELGATMRQNFHFRFQQFPRKSFHMEWTDVIKDEYGKVAERRMHDSYKIEVGEPGGIPEQMVREIMTRHSPDYTRVFE